MEKRTSLFVASFCALMALAGLGWGLQQQKKLAALSFHERRLALVEAENGRLREVLAAAEKARTQADNIAQRASIESDTASLRHLDFLQPVHYAVLTRAGIKDTIGKKLAAQMSAEDFRKAGLGLAALGLLPRDYPLQQKYLELLGEQVAAFYDQHQHQLFMFEDAALASAQNRLVLAHELTHALQDQHFGLLKLPLEIKDNDDRVFAASALIEGDATLVMSQFMLRHLTSAGLRDTFTGALTQNMRQLQEAPRYLREMLVFPYLRGQEFCAALLARGGWSALDAAYQNPPSSTAQILHPEKFLANPREEPVAIDFVDTTVHGEKPLTDNVLGEMGTRLLLAQWIDAKAAEEAAAQWRGDRYLVYDHGDAMVWKTQWENGAPFYSMAQMYLENRYKTRMTVTEGGTDFAKSPRWLILKYDHREGVLLIDAATKEWAEALARKFLNSPGWVEDYLK